MLRSGTRKRTSVRREQNELSVRPGNRTCDCFSQVIVARSHVIKRTVWLHMVRAHAGRIRDRLENSELVRDRVENFLGRYRQFLAAEILSIEKARMRAYGNVAVACGLDCATYGAGITGVKTAGDVCRGDQRQQLVVSAGAFAEIGV